MAPSIYQDIFSGTASGADQEDFNAFKRTMSQNNFYKMAAAPVLGTKFNTSTWSPAESFATTALQAFLGSALNRFGQIDEGRQIEKVASVLPQLYSDPLSVTAPEGVDTEAFAGLKGAAVTKQEQLSGLYGASVLKDVFSAGIGDERSKEAQRRQLFASVFSKTPNLAVKAMPDIAKEMGVTEVGDSSVGAPAMPEAKDSSGLENGKLSTTEKYKQYFNELLNSGVPATQAATAAREQIQGETKANAKSFDDAKAARDYGQKLLELASTARAGMSQAGKTGPYNSLATAYENIAETFGSQEAAGQLAGDAVLNSIAPELVKMSRSPGAVSDYETRLYLGSGPNVKQTPESNAILTKKLEDIGKLNLDYADFLEAYKEANAGSTVGAGKKWSQYRQAFPLFVGEGEQMQLNSDRPSWQEYFATAGQDASQGLPYGTALPSDAPTVGSSFNGEQVLSVTRVE